MSFKFYIFSLNLLILFRICSASPLRPKDTFFGGIKENQRNEGNVLESSLGVLAIGLASSVCLVIVVGICVCCGKNKFFQWPRRQVRRVVTSNSRNGVGHGHEISIFPPPGADYYLSSSTSDIYFEPLPDITSQLGNGSGPPRLSASVSSNLNEDWFAEPYKNFPRNQLQYLRKLGSGWFGQVLEGRAIGIDTDHTSTAITEGSNSKLTPVVVKSLREDASQHEQAVFLQELKPYKDLDHKNILKILAYCLETQPLLVLLQFCPKGDLKGFLKRNTTLTDSNLLKMAEDVSAGLTYMHMHDFILTDLAARNCLVEEDMNVRIGDYGYTLQVYEEDYYLAGNVALPLRWCSPETLKCTDTTIETIELTKSANVWSFGVLLWEILSRGKLPYEELDEDGVIQKVVLERTRVLRAPLHDNSFYTSKLDEILLSCFGDSRERPKIQSLYYLLEQLGSCLADTSSADDDFESRWCRLSDNQQSHEHSIAIVNDSFDLRFESDFNPGSGLRKKSSPTASLKNLHGSAEDLDARIAAKFGSAVPSWLGLEPGQQMDSFTEEISDAIQKLDEALSEDRSETATSTSSPEKACSNFRLGRDSLVLNPPLGSRTLSADGEEENLTMRLEQGDFSELVRLKSQSVQDFMRLTVVDDGSDSSDKTSQPGSIVGEFNTLHYPQEKNFSSESNLKEAVRDAGFMVELEKLQAELKYSIISEVSREGMPSLEDTNHERETSPNHNNGECDTTFLDDEIPGTGMEGTSVSGSENSLDRILKSKELNSKSKGEISPDCVVSSRDALPSDPLPDILSHDGKAALLTSSNSSLEEDKKSIVASNDKLSLIGNNLGEFNVELDNDSISLEKRTGDQSLSQDIFLNSNGINTNGLNEQNLQIKNDHSNQYELNSESKLLLSNENLKYHPEKLVQGEDIVIGASDDFSLELYKPVKSNMNVNNTVVEYPFVENNQPKDMNFNSSVHNKTYSNSNAIITESSKEEESSLSNVEMVPDLMKRNQDHLKVNGLISVNENSLNGSSVKTGDVLGVEVFSSNSLELGKELNGSCKSNSNEFDLFGHNIEIDRVKSVHSDSLSRMNKISRDSLLDKKKDFSDSLLDGNCEEFLETEGGDDGRSIDSLLDSEFKFLDDNFESSEVSSNLESCDNTLNRKLRNIGTVVDMEESANLGRLEVIVNETAENLESPEESGAFWEKQMAAWQEAAEQTRELLYEASSQDAFGVSQDSEDDLLDVLTKSPESSQKSPFSSTDCLDESDEGTYVSYDTTDDDEIVRLNAEDLDALRSELSLKLGDLNLSSEVPKEENDEETDNDVVFINYKNGSTLSPIKEEELPADLDQSFASDSSVEFTEESKTEKRTLEEFLGSFANPSDDPRPIEITPLKLGGPPSLELTAEEAKDSLILEDLDCEGTPTQPVIVGPLIPSNSSEDLLVVDTETNKVTLIDSGRPQSHIAFLVEDDKEDAKFVSDSEAKKYDEDEDVAFESLPYEDNLGSGNFSSPKSKDSRVEESPKDSNIEGCSENPQIPHYQSYFTSALSSISHPTLSLEGNDTFESADHVSLPYDVNFPVQNPAGVSEGVSINASKYRVVEKENGQALSSESEREATILDDIEAREDAPPGNTTTSSPFVTLSFLGRLYNEAEKTDLESADRAGMDSEPPKPEELNESLGSSEHFYSTKSDDDSSDNEIEEDIPADATPQRECSKTPTPLRTPSHLEGFVWRTSPSSNPSPQSHGGGGYECYTPDWEEEGEDTDSEGIDDVESSSTSGEFVWQPADSCGGSAAPPGTSVCLPSTDETSLEWEKATGGDVNQGESSEPKKMGEDEIEETAERLGEGEIETEEDSESGEEEFTPSTWNRDLTPHRSLLKSPENSTLGGEKKSVHWKRQRHHRVYEYPPEPQSWHAPEMTIPTSSRRSWGGGHSLDYLTLADWELGGDEFLGDDSDDFEEFYTKGVRTPLNGPQIYSLAPFTYDKNHEDFLGDGCDFYMGSPGSAFAFSRSSFTPAEYFPTTQNSTHHHPSEYDFLYQESNDSKVIPRESSSDDLQGDGIPTSAEGKPQHEESKLSREKLRLDLPTLCLAESNPGERVNEAV